MWRDDKDDTWLWLALAGFGGLGFGLSEVVRRFGPAGQIPAEMEINGSISAWWSRQDYANADLVMTAIGLLGGIIMLLLYRQAAPDGESTARRQDVLATIAACAIGLVLITALGLV